MSEAKIPNRAEQLVYKALQKAVEQDKLRIYLDYGKVNRPQSPVYEPWECLLPVLVPVLIGLGLIVSVGVIFGLLFIAGMIVVYSVYFKKKLYRRLIERTKAYLVYSLENCKKLWNWGGIVLVNADNKKIGCVAPEGDWKEFVVINYADLMTENSNNENKESEPETGKSKPKAG